MNEQIYKLSEQASEYAVLNPSEDILTSETADAKVEVPKAFIDKFAELIVRECVQTLIDNTPERYTNESAEEDWDKGYDRAMKDCVHHIQEHFGVDE